MILRLDHPNFAKALEELEKCNPAERVAFFAKGTPSHFLLWYFYYFPEDFSSNLADFHYDWIDSIHGENNVLIEGFRGSAKTSLTIASIVYFICIKRYRFIAFQSYESKGSTRNTTQIALKLMNDTLEQDYGVLFKTSGGRQELEKRSVGDFDTTNGVKVISASLGEKLRGSLHKNARIECLVLDDVDTTDSVQNPDIIQKNYDKITGETFGALSKEKSKIIFLGNTINSDGIVPRFRKEKTSWDIHHQPLIKDGVVQWKLFTPDKIEKIKQNEGNTAFAQNYLLIPNVRLGNPVFTLDKVITPQYTIDTRYKEIHLHRPPEYSIFGVDTSLGNGGDYSTIIVRNLKREMLVSYKGQSNPEVLADIVLHLFNLGYKGKMIVENNSIGYATIQKLVDTPCISYLHYEKEIDTITQRTKKKYGFNTNAKSRTLIINRMRELIDQGLEMDDRELDEARNFYYNQNGKPEALSNQHDDMIMADAMCLYGVDIGKVIEFV